MKRSTYVLASAFILASASIAPAQTVIVPGEPVTVSPSVVIPPERVVVYRDRLIEAYPEPVIIEQDLEVGMVLPETVVVQPVPETIVTEVPEAAAYHYVVVEDEVVFVEPGSNRVVAVVRE